MLDISIMQMRYLPVIAGLATVAAVGLIADRTAQQRHYVLPNHETTEGRMMLPNGWRVTPAGKHIELPGDLPMKMIITADGKLLVNTAGWHDHDVNVIDIKTGKLEQSFDIGKNWDGMSLDPATGTLYLSSGGTPKAGYKESAAQLKHHIAPEVMDSVLHPVLRLHYAAGKLSFQQPVSIEGVKEDSYYISGVTYKAGILYVLEINASKIFRLSGKDLTTQISAPTGSRPYAAELSPDGKTLAVSNWGAESVSLLDPETLKEIKVIHTGSHPNEMLWDSKGRLFVANSGSNSVSVIANAEVTETIKTSLDPKALVGSTPDALAMSHDGKRLYVANADNNDVAVIDVSEKGDSKTLGFIPTGWYPTAVAVSPDDRRIFIGTGKGLKFNANYPRKTDYPRPFPRPEQPYDYIGGVLSGAVSIVDVPDAHGLAAYTKQVLANLPVPKDEVNVTEAQAIERNAFSKIKHVIYIIRENRTYDQVLGDLGIGNGDPELTLFGKNVTPNGHALARRFVTLDNIYCNGEVSEDGHQWCDAAYATDFTQKAWVNSYSKRGEPKAAPEVVASPAGYLWDNCRTHGVSFRSYGEGRIIESSPEAVPTMDLKGALLGHVAKDWPRAAFVDRDYKRVDYFINELHQAEKTGVWPQFMIMSLGENHTEGLAGGKLTPVAHVASNDLGIGKLVEAVSRSKFWPETAIFMIEDDAQNGPDHVDAHRTIGLVISPYVKRKTLDSTMYTTASMVRTMELILGLPPMTQFDQLATPMYNSFTTQADTSIVEALPAVADLEARNPKGGPGDSASRHLDFSDFDRADPDELNRILWDALKPGHEMPAPVRSARLVWR
jgi:YVTN family beta-propeller protein